MTYYLHNNGVIRDSVECLGQGLCCKPQPVAVIAFEDREQVERLADLFTTSHHSSQQSNTASEHGVRSMQAALCEFANPTPPRPNEPGTWGVVEASCVHDDQRRKWMRHEDDNWYPIGPVGRQAGLPDDWDSLIDPALVREGVSE